MRRWTHHPYKGNKKGDRLGEKLLGDDKRRTSGETSWKKGDNGKVGTPSELEDVCTHDGYQDVDQQLRGESSESGLWSMAQETSVPSLWLEECWKLLSRLDRRG